jgi:dihydrofolate reductase
MRSVILSIMVSLDGFIEGPDKDIKWHVWDDEMNKYMRSFFNRVDLLLFGRVTYELMFDFWPQVTTEDPVIAERMNNLPKIVFSRHLKKVEWNSKLVKDNIQKEINYLKQTKGKDMVIFGGADIASTFMQMDLIDEYQIIVNPVILGGGTPFFKGIQKKIELKLIRSQSYRCGNVLLSYKSKIK